MDELEHQNYARGFYVWKSNQNVNLESISCVSVKQFFHHLLSGGALCRKHTNLHLVPRSLLEGKTLRS